MVITEGLSILISQKNSFNFIHICYWFLPFYFIYFCSDLYDFFLLTLGFVCSSFSSCFRCKVRLLIWDLSCFLRWDCIAINFVLRTAFAAFHRNWVLVFSLSIVSRYFLISSLISSVIHWLFSSILFTLHMFVFFTVFICFCNWFLISYCCGQKICLIWFQFSYLYWDLICDPRCDLSWRLFHVYLRRKCILPLSDGRSYKYELSLLVLMCH